MLVFVVTMVFWMVVMLGMVMVRLSLTLSPVLTFVIFLSHFGLSCSISLAPCDSAMAFFAISPY